MSTGLGPVLVTGATGFIGSALAARLSAERARAVCLVREGADPAASSGLESRSIGAGTTADLARAIGDFRPEVVIHLAAAGVRPEVRDPESIVDGNVGLTARLVAALADRPPRRFLHIGSCSEYAPAAEPTRIREDHPLDPPSLYGAAKAAAYLCGRALAARAAVPFVTLRLFGVLGPGEAPTRLVPQLLSHYREGRTPALTPGEQARDFTFVDDVVDALLAAAASPGLEPGLAYNVCSGVATRVREVAEIAARVTGFAGDLGLGRRPYREDEPMWIVGDPGQFQVATGWRPRVPLAEAVRRMADVAEAGPR